MDSQITNLTPKEFEAISKLKEEVLRQFGDGVEIILFGSKARGDSHEESDIDILVLVDTNDRLYGGSKLQTRIHDIAYDIEFEYNFDIDFQVIARSKKWWKAWKDALPFAQNVAREGIFLWQKKM